MNLQLPAFSSSKQIERHEWRSAKTDHQKKQPRPIDNTLLDTSLNEDLKELMNKQMKKLKHMEETALEGLYVQSLALHTIKDGAPVIEAVGRIPEALQILFDKLSGLMLHLSKQDVHQTTLILNADSSSVFYGSKITITEYSSAPKIFNVQFSSTPEAAALFQSHSHELMALFHERPRNFTIHRIETDLLSSEEILIYRNLPINQDQDDEQDLS